MNVKNAQLSKDYLQDWGTHIIPWPANTVVYRDTHVQRAFPSFG